MKYLFLFGILICSISLSAQVQEENRIFNSVLQAGEQLEFGDKSIRFKEVISDSRCPKDVTCIWAGEAKVLIEIFEKGKLINEKLVVIDPNITDEIPLPFSSGDGIYSISVFRLFPHPSAASKKNTMHYSMELKVSEHL
ncbi:MAG TPA: hypothetical protein VFD29_03560 [Gillisia sp.]|nr:hypothetical protein [Gillisia sp.]